ncbi:MAG TPA: GDSL-type esterase/lipase family protein, partial [Thermoanaerobaculia bacterium]
ASDVLDFLRKRGGVEVANLAVNGAVSADVRELVSNANVRAVAATADWILLSAGGNDLSHAVPRSGGPPPAALEDIRRARSDYAANLRAILGGLREANPRAPIFVLALYDPFDDGSAAARAGAAVITGWNSVLQETALSFPAIVVVPTFDLFQGRPDRLAVDRFHPNRDGYSAIAQRIEQVIPW